MLMIVFFLYNDQSYMYNYKLLVVKTINLNSITFQERKEWEKVGSLFIIKGAHSIGSYQALWSKGVISPVVMEEVENQSMVISLMMKTLS